MASGMVLSPRVPWGHLAVNPTILTLSGVFLDVILMTYQQINFEWSSEQFMTMIKQLPITYMSRPYFTGDFGYNALSRTLVADHSEGFLGRLSNNEINKFTKMLLRLVAFRKHLSTRFRTLAKASRHPIGDDHKTAKEGYESFFNSIRFLDGYKFCVTANSYVAMVPDIAKEGDRIFVLYGSRVPHVLRAVPEMEDTYQTHRCFIRPRVHGWGGSGVERSWKVGGADCQPNLKYSNLLCEMFMPRLMSLEQTL